MSIKKRNSSLFILIMCIALYHPHAGCIAVSRTVLNKAISVRYMEKKDCKNSRFDEFVGHLKNLSGDTVFPEFKINYQSINEILSFSKQITNYVKENVAIFPTQLQNLFLDPAYIQALEASINEMIAMEYVIVLLTAPLELVPSWKNFVEVIVELLKNSTTFGSFRNALEKQKDATNFLFVGFALEKHMKTLPAQIKEEADIVSFSQLIKQLKAALKK